MLKQIARYAALVLLAAFFAAQSFAAQVSSVLGDWTEPTGSVIHVGSCGTQVCLWVIAVSKQAPSATDIYNPNPTLRRRPLCGLRIGSGFLPRDAAHAVDGTLYDPKTGKTWHGQITARGATLFLRGYLGVPLFGRSQTWTRAIAPPQPCPAPPE